MRPVVSVVLEAYNEEQNALSPPDDTLNGLLRQDFPLTDVELILIGSPQQIECWTKLSIADGKFGRVRMLAVDPSESHYWQIKNRGAEAAQAAFVALLDCDTVPGPRWLSSIVNALHSGADVSVGPSQYRTPQLEPNSAWMLAAALPSWSFVLGRSSSIRPGNLLAHNFAFRRELLESGAFRHHEASFQSSLLYFDLVRSGAKLAFQPEQRVAHAINLRWWLARRHFRTGWETYIARKAHPDWPRISALEKLKFIEPPLLRMGLVCRDARHWFRYSRVLGVSRMRSLRIFPLAVLASFAARTAEMIGMYAALFAPKSTEHQARF